MRRFVTSVLSGAVLLGATVLPAWGQSGGELPFVGQIMWVPYTFVPRNWAACDGQLLPIAQNTALFSLLGTQFGGNGQTNFALPNFQGRLMVGAGQGAGLSPYDIGQMGGEETHTLAVSEMPAHNHSFAAYASGANATSGAGAVHGNPANVQIYGTGTGTTLQNMSPAMVNATGGTQPHNNMMPYVVLRCIIALAGVFPPRP